MRKKGSFSLTLMAISQGRNREKIPPRKVLSSDQAAWQGASVKAFRGSARPLMAKYTCRPHEVASEKGESPWWHLFFSHLLGDSPGMYSGENGSTDLATPFSLDYLAISRQDQVCVWGGEVR